MADDWRIQFNNYVQKNGLISQVAWSQPLQTGPQNSPTWTASVFVNAIEYGRGSAANLGGAREIAAEMALRALSMQFDNFKAYAERNGLMPYVFFSRPVQTKAQGQEPITPTWSTSVFINGVEYGSGSAFTLGGARNIAAGIALKTLRRERGD